jgi:hypothetical protein
MEADRCRRRKPKSIHPVGTAVNSGKNYILDREPHIERRQG